MPESKMEKLEKDIAELRALIEKAERPGIKDLLGISLRKIETELIMLKEQEGPRSNEEEANVKSKPAATTTKAYDVQVKNFSWDQSDKFVKIYVTGLNKVQALDSDQIVKNFTTTSVQVKALNLDGKNHVFSIKETCEKINPDKSYVKVKPDMLVIFMAKASTGEKWSDLRAFEKVKTKTDTDTSTRDEDAGDNSIMRMLKKIYDEGDDTMKQAMAKAWTQGQDKKDLLS